MTRPLGARIERGRTKFTVRSPRASALWLCLFANEAETRIAMQREGENWFADLPENLAGQCYGFRAEGDWAPERGLWFDPAKLLVDPYALELDRRFVQDPRLAEFGFDTAGLVPRAIVPGKMPTVRHRLPRFRRGDLIYEVNVRSFTIRHPDIPDRTRGTIGALAHPAIIAHLRKLGVGAVELMPIVGWIDERHLPPLGLANAWGYNPVALMALDKGLCPGGVAELRETVDALHQAGIGVILDLVFNHTGESDIHGGVLSLRGLDNQAYAHAGDGTPINDTGCGNTLDFANPALRTLVLESLRHFVRHCGIDGFRFDLATIMARGPAFSEQAPIFAELAADPVLSDRVLIAEPWDIGPGGYQLGRFPPNWLEWNDRFRDDVRRFWRGDGAIGRLATRLAGSSDLFGKDCRSVNFLAAHDGMTLADTVAYAEKHNHANGEDNRDGHDQNHSWNCGVEGPSSDPAIAARRRKDQRALLASLFVSVGTILLTAGDEFGRSQSGNNNAYCQDNPISWIDWAGRDLELEDFVTGLARTRRSRRSSLTEFPEPGEWRKPDGDAMTFADWDDPRTDGVTYCPVQSDFAIRLQVSRRERSVAWAADPGVAL